MFTKKVNTDDLLADLAGAANQPWSVMPDRAPALSSIIAAISAGKDVPPTRLQAALAAHARETQPTFVPTNTRGKSIAVITLAGTALYATDFPPYAFSTKKLSMTVSELATDQSVGGIVLIFATPGGSVTGVSEAANAIYAARQKKPVVAFVDPLCASAGYWLASQANQIFSVPSGDTGSIGVFMLHVDMSRALDAEGITPTFVYAGDRKIDGNPFQPLSDRAKADAQHDVDSLYKDFIGAVARGRGITTSKVKTDFGQGRVLMSRDALRVGMIDKIGDLQSAFSSRNGALSPTPARSRVAVNNTQRGSVSSEIEAMRRKLAIKRYK